MVPVTCRASLLPFGTQTPREQLVQGLLLWSHRVEASGAPFEFKCGVASRVFSDNLSCSWGLNTSFKRVGGTRRKGIGRKDVRTFFSATPPSNSEPQDL